MKNSFSFCLFLFLFFLQVTGLGNISDSSKTVSNYFSTIALKTYVEENTVPLNRIVVFQIELSWKGDMSRYQIVEIPQPVLTNLLSKGSGSANRLEALPDGGHRSTKTITYQFSAVEMGMAYIGGLEIKYHDSLTGDSDVLYTQRVSVKIIDPIPDEGSNGFQAVIYIALLIIFSVTVIYFLIQYYRKRKQQQACYEQHLDLAEHYLKKLSCEVDPKGANLAEMTIMVSKIFREYLSKEFKIPISTSKVEDVLERLSGAGIESSEMKKLDELFKKSDVIKFAGGNVDPAEFSNLYGIVENFLTSRVNTQQPG